MIYILLIVFRLTMTSFYFADILPLHMFREWSRNSIRLHWHAHLLNHSICFQIFRKKFQHYGIEFLHVISSLACSLKNLALTYFFTLKQVIRRSLFAMLVVCSPCLKFAHPLSWIKNFRENKHCSHGLTFRAHKNINFTHCMRLLIQWVCIFSIETQYFLWLVGMLDFFYPFPHFSFSLWFNVYNHNEITFNNENSVKYGC